tara:strand:+ start:573 stop:3626 length:3054 start_codon:yes stop_codon:yes gene_type:complete
MARSAPRFKRYIESITITNAGNNYSSIAGEAELFISAPSGSPESDQIQAVATLDIQNGSIAGVIITNEGDGYGTTPEVIIRSGIGLGTSSLTNTTVADTRRDAGTYTGIPIVSSKSGTGALATVVVDSNGAVTSVTVTTTGSKYCEGEIVTITDISIGGVNNATDMTFTIAQLTGGGNGAILTPVINTLAKQPAYFHDNMSYLIDSQIPDYIHTDYPNFARFIKDYFRYMDLGPTELGALNLVDGQKKHAPNHLLQELIDKLNLDHSIEATDDFLQPLLEQYAIDFPATAEVDSRLLIKHVRDFFESKGSRKGVEQFFKMLFNEDVEVFLPSEFILRPSDGIFQKELTIKAYANTEISPQPDPLSLRGKRVDVHYYESTASITARKVINTSVTRVKEIAYTAPTAYEMTLDLPGGTIIPGQGVEGELTAVIGGRIATVGTIGAADALRTAGTYDIDTGFSTNGNGSGAQFTVVVNSSGAASITVDTVGDNYAPDETITIPDSLLGGGGAAALTFKVATITNGKIFSVTITNAGAGYSANPAVIIQPNSADTITTTAVIDTRLTNGSLSNTVFVNNVQGVGYNHVPTLILNTDAVRSWIGLEGLGDVIENKTAFLTRVLNSVTLKTNSGTTNGGFVIGETFKVSETGDILGVYAIDYFAEDYTITGIDNNALVRIKTLDANKYPSVLEVISTGTGFQRSTFDFVLRSETNETATITCNTGFSHTFPGAFKNSRGFLSDANKIQDNAVYQNFAYQVRTSRPKTQWGELLDRIAHPAGMIAWTDLQILQTVNMGENFNALPDVIVFRLFAEIENPLVQDVPVLFFHKPAITDSVDWADQRTGASTDTILLFPHLGKVESPDVDDQINKFDVTMAKTESVDWSEAVAKDVHLPAVADSVDWSELVDLLLVILREPEDSVDWAETVIRTVELNKTESIDWSEVVSKQPNLAKTESVDWSQAVAKESDTVRTDAYEFDDANVLLFTGVQTEEIAWGESGQIIAQNYAGDYFAEDYVGEVRSIS